MRITINSDSRGTHVEIPAPLAAAFERTAESLLADVREDGGPLVSLGEERAMMIRPGFVAQVTQGTDGKATITTRNGFVFKVDEDYKSVQEKLGGRPKGEADA